MTVRVHVKCSAPSTAGYEVSPEGFAGAWHLGCTKGRRIHNQLEEHR
jgi:hypothetical protein